MLLLAVSVQAATLEVVIDPTLFGEPVNLGKMVSAPGGNEISITRLSCLLDEFALGRSDGSWSVAPGQTAWLDLEKRRLSFQITNAPNGIYDKIKFRIGLNESTNHANPSDFGPAHPLNPNVNGLHWSWQGGYVFLALEGLWSKTNGTLSGFSYHLANDWTRMETQLPLSLDLRRDSIVRLKWDLDKIWSAKHRIPLTQETQSTHSRKGDDLAARLAENVRNSFSFLSSVPLDTVLARRSTPLNAQRPGTPYPLTIPAFFPVPSLPLDNPITAEGVALGRELFHEAALSKGNTQSCASCHQESAAFSEPGRRFSVGADGQPGSRNAMPLFNLAWKSSFFWDGRSRTLREQVLMPIENPVEMHETMTNVVQKLHRAQTKPYRALFLRAFGSEDITSERIALALEQYLLTLTSHDSKFDRVLMGKATLTSEEERGFELFHTEYDPRRGQYGADCFHCHGGPLFQSQTFANNGLNSESAEALTAFDADAVHEPSASSPALRAPSPPLEMEVRDGERRSQNSLKDQGRFLVTGNPADKSKFAVPSLRNVVVTGPYMHDGRFQTLEEVVEHYSTGVKRSPTLDPNLAKHPDGGLGLSAEDKHALVAFLRTLTDSRYETTIR